MKIGITSNIEAIAEGLRNMPRHIPFATSYAINLTGQVVKAGLVAEMPKAFDRPTPYTLNALQLTPGTKDKPEAVVGMKDLGPVSGRAENYLSPEVFGGGRKIKAFEKALQAKGIMPAGTVAVIPGKSSWAARIDRYGNMQNGLIVQLLAYFEAFHEMGFKANMDDKGRAEMAKIKKKDELVTIGGVVYFIAGGWHGDRRTRHLAPGIWAKKGTHGSNIAPVLLFVKPASYKPRFDFYGIGNAIAARELPNNTKLAVVKALSTAWAGRGMAW